MKVLYIFGTESTAKEIEEVVQESYDGHFDQIKRLYFYGEESKDNSILDLQEANHIHFNIGFSEASLRKDCISFCLKNKLIPFTVINRSAYIAKSAKIGVGCYIAANASISSDAKIGDFCQLNLNCSIGHDVNLGNNTIVLPGARISGNVCIGSESLIGSNAFVYQGVKLGKNNKVDALTYINKDLEDDIISISSTKTKSLKRT